MIQIAEVPLKKYYTFPLLSDATFLKIILYAAALLLPFFAVYSTNSTYHLK